MLQFIEEYSLAEVLDIVGEHILDLKSAFARIDPSLEDSIDIRYLAPLLREVLPDVTSSRIYWSAKDFISTYGRFSYVDVVYLLGYLLSNDKSMKAASENVTLSTDDSQSTRLPLLLDTYHSLKMYHTENVDMTDINALRRQRIRYFQTHTSSISSSLCLPSIPQASSLNKGTNSEQRSLSCSPHDLSTERMRYASLGFWWKVLRLDKEVTLAAFRSLDVNSIYEGDSSSFSEMAVLYADLSRLMDSLHLTAAEECWEQHYVSTIQWS